MIAAESHHTRHRIGPYSRRFQRGAIGDLYDGRSAEGRFIRHLEAELTRHVGGKPSIVQRMLIDRIVKVRIQLDLLDERLASGNWTPHDQRTHGGLLNAYRLLARELGLKAVEQKPASLADITTRISATRRAS